MSDYTISSLQVGIHTGLQAGLGVLAVGNTPEGLFFGKSSNKDTLLGGAIFGASSALIFNATYCLFRQKEEYISSAQKAKLFALSLFLGMVGGSKITTAAGFSLTVEASFLLSVRMVLLSPAVGCLILGIIILIPPQQLRKLWRKLDD